MRVLVVDDDPEVLALLHVALNSTGLSNDTAVDGVGALEMLQMHRYAIMVLDLRMPRLDGFGVLEAVSRLRPRPFLVVMTGHHEEHRSDLPPELVDVVISKPFDVAVLSGVLSDCVEQLTRSGRFEH